jgi:desulfoferrodoxin (superoxide reductase-like protein)
MTDVNISLHYNEEAQEVELKVGDEVVGSSGKDYFEHWAKLWADKNGYVKAAEVVALEPVPAPQPEPVPEVDTPAEPVVD